MGLRSILSAWSTRRRSTRDPRRRPKPAPSLLRSTENLPAYLWTLSSRMGLEVTLPLRPCLEILDLAAVSANPVLVPQGV